jgi:hypothetical protein
MSFYGSPISLENNIIKFSEMVLADSGTNRRVRLEKLALPSSCESNLISPGSFSLDSIFKGTVTDTTE